MLMLKWQRERVPLKYYCIIIYIMVMQFGLFHCQIHNFCQIQNFKTEIHFTRIFLHYILIKNIKLMG